MQVLNLAARAIFKYFDHPMKHAEIKQKLDLAKLFHLHHKKKKRRKLDFSYFVNLYSGREK